MTSPRTTRGRGVRAEVPVTREAIVDAAFRLIEEKGGQGFSMRAVANELGVFPATLYWHVGDRARLLGLVEQRWVEGVQLPDGALSPREWLIEVGRRYRRQAHLHPNVARMVAVERARNTEALSIPDAVLGRMDQLGFGDDLVHVYNAVVGAVQGFIVLELAMVAEPTSPSATSAEEELRSLDPERFPHLTRHFDQLADRALSLRWSDSVQRPLDDSFEFLLRVLLDGVEAQRGSSGTRPVD